MRILRVAQKLYPEYPGGGTYHVHALSRDQAAAGHEVTVLTVSENRSLPRHESRDGYRIIRTRPTAELLGNSLSVGLARELRDADDYDVIHAHSHLYFATNLASLKRTRSPIPLAITNHGLYSQTVPDLLFSGYLRTVGRWTFNAADEIFCYTATDRDRLEEFGVTSPISVIPNGVDTERFTPGGDHSDHIDHDGPVVLFVGRLVDGKRPQDAIDAVTTLPADMNAKLYVIGEGPLSAELAAQSGDRVEFLGQLPYDEMPAIYRAGDVLVLPSRAEGLPRVVLEAFASGVPVVSSHLEHTAPVVQRAGETVSIGDVSGYMAAIRRVLDARDKLAEQGRETVASEYQWDQTVTETTARLKELVANRSTGG